MGGGVLVARLQVGQASWVFQCLGVVIGVQLLGFLGTYPPLAMWALMVDKLFTMNCVQSLVSQVYW